MTSGTAAAVVLCVGVAAFCSPACSGPRGARDYYVRAEMARARGNADGFLRNLELAVGRAPDNPLYIYALARAWAIKGDYLTALKCLDRAARLGFAFNGIPGGVPAGEAGDLSALSDRADYRVLLRRLDEQDVPVLNSRPAFTIGEKDLIPEGIAYDPASQAFFLGSMFKRKIVRCEEGGPARDFTSEAQDGLWGVSGLAVDPERRSLWVNSTSTRRMKDAGASAPALTAVFRYDLESGRLIRRYALNEVPWAVSGFVEYRWFHNLIRNTHLEHLFNDLAVGRRGEVYITDSLFGAVYMIPPETDRLELWSEPRALSYPNGLALSDDGKHLYVSHAEGISVFDTETRRPRPLAHPEDISTAPVDGLYYYRNSLIAIQGAFRPARVIRYILDDRSERIARLDILEAGNSLFDIPTTGVVVGDEFYYIANSQLSSFGKDNAILPLDRLSDVVVLKVRL